jgi:4-amino-4-deoxychorismate lyase
MVLWCSSGFKKRISGTKHIFNGGHVVEPKMILVNGEDCRYVDASDRGFQYGDGLFETLEVVNNQPAYLDLHLHRLNHGCNKLQIPFPGFELLKQEISLICKSSEHSVLKIIITRGVGGRGYKMPEASLPTRVLSLHPFPEYPHHYQKQGITARFCTTRLGLNPDLAGIKHLNRLEQVLARAEWQDNNIQEGILLDINNNVIEGVMTNIFYVKNMRLYTPKLTDAGVLGIMRHLILHIANNENILVTEHTVTKNDLLTADELFVCNSIIGLWPVNQLETSRFSPGIITRQLQTSLANSKQKASFCEQ